MNLQFNSNPVLEKLITKLVNSTACHSLSAPNNFGKSYLLRSLVASTERPANLATQLVTAIYLDCNLRADDTAQAFYELILRALLPSFGERVNGLAALYEQVCTLSGFGGARAFLVAMERILESLTAGKRLVLLLDEFDQPLLSLPATSFRHLRALRDRYSEKLVYWTATNLPIVACGRQDETDIAEFYELFEPPNYIQLPALSRAATVALAFTIGLQFNAAQLECLYDWSGGHPTLIRLIAPLLVASSQNQAQFDSTEEWEATVRNNQPVQLKCRRIWQSLDPGEQTALLQWLDGVRSGSQNGLIGSLAERGLVRLESLAGSIASEGSTIPDQMEARIFARAFEWFVGEQLQAASPASLPLTSLPQPVTSPLAYDPLHQVVVFEGGKRRVPLSGNTAALFSYLYPRQSIPYCTKDELISAVWGQQMAYSSENLDRLVSDLRQLLSDNDKQIIRTIHRRGLQMVGVIEWLG